MKKSGYFILGLLGLVLILGGLPAVYAQESATEEFTLEEITVTAEKREENVQKEAMSITVLSGDKLATESTVDLKAALSNLAGVNVLGIPMGGQVFIRGIGSTVDANQADPSVSVNIDNVYLGRTEAMFSSMYDVERVEVLRGPQSTMYGRNAAGGQINVITKKPTDQFEANANLSLGNYSMYNIQAALNIPFSPQFAARFAVNKDSRDGYIDDGSDSTDKKAFRGRFSYKPTDRLSFLLSAEFTYDKSNPANTVPVEGSAGNLPRLGPPPAFGYTVPDADGDGAADDADGNGVADIVESGWVTDDPDDPWSNDPHHPAPSNDLEFQFYQLEINWDMGWGELVLLPTLNKNERSLRSEMIFGNSRTAAGVDALQQQPFTETQWSGEARIQAPADAAFQWLAGVYYIKADNKDVMAGGTTLTLLEQSEAMVGNPQNATTWVTQAYRRPTDVYAYYGQITYPFTDRLRVTAGVRYNQDNRSQGYRIVNWDITDPTDPFYDAADVIDGRHQFDSGVLEYEDKQKNILYKGQVEYDLSENSMLYGGIITGMKAGGLNVGSYPVTEFKPEENINYSAGIKNRFLNNRMQLNLEAYYYDYKNQQIQVSGQAVNPFTGNFGFTQTTQNAGPTTYKGFEIEMDYLFTPKDQITANVSNQYGEWGEMTVGQNPLANLTTDFELTGYDTPQTPKWSGTLGYQHTFDLSNGGSLTGKIQTKLSSGYYATHEVYSPGAWADSYHMSDFYLTYGAPNGKYSAGLWAKNLENFDQTVRVMPAYRRSISSPRTYGVNFNINF